MQRRYITVDVFTDRAFGGNPLAVVLDAGGLSTAQMQAIATRVQLFGDDLRAAAGRSRPRRAGPHLHRAPEIPFAGHPNVGTAFVLATLAAKPPARLLFEEKAGLVPVEILTEQGKVVSTELTAPQPLKRMSHLRRRAGRGLPLAVGRRCQDRPASAADHLGRAAVSGRGAWHRARRCGGRGRMRRRSRRPFPATAATRSISTRATCPPAKSRATCRRGCFIPAPAACPRIPPPAAPRPPPRRCSPISPAQRMAN